MTIYPLLSIIIFLSLYCLSPFMGSVNFVNSSKQIVTICLYVLLYLLSARFFINKRVVFVSIAVICFVSGALYILHSIAPSLFSFLKPNSLQFIIPTNGGHNHLGDLMGMGLISLFITPLSLIYQVFIGIAYLFFVIISFSKSAFLAVIATLFFIMLARKGKYIFLFICITSTAVISVMIYTQEFSSFKPISILQNQMEKFTHLKPKSLLSSRDIYVAQAAQSWITASLEHSFFGYGPGNFIYASNKSAYHPSQATTDTHNILLTIMMESGVLTAFWFLLFFILTIFTGKKTKNSLAFLVIYLFANFQTDYTYRIPLFFILFFFLSGQIIAPLFKKEARVLLHYLVAIVFGIAFCFSVYALYLDQSQKKLTSQLHLSLSTKNITLFNETSKNLEAITPYDESLLIDLSTHNEELDNKEEAIRLLEKLSLYSPHEYLSFFPHQLDLQKKIKVDLKKYLEGRKKDFAQFPFTKEEKNKLNVICKNYAKISCF